MPAPPPCVSSKYGCCWDKKTFASGPIGSGTENCPGLHFSFAPFVGEISCTP